MSESSAKGSQALASKGDKDTSEKRGRGRPRKKPQVRRDAHHIPNRSKGPGQAPCCPPAPHMPQEEA
uniref:HMGA1 protein n=1 Tax=Dromaius novaehollandiae TaxID=8790 RepID=A0A8C4KCQ2_DRONO